MTLYRDDVLRVEGGLQTVTREHHAALDVAMDALGLELHWWDFNARFLRTKAGGKCAGS